MPLALFTPMRLHAKVSLIAFFGLVHFGVARLVFVFGGARCSDDGGIGNTFVAQIYAAEITECFDVLQGVFAGLIGEVEPVTIGR